MKYYINLFNTTRAAKNKKKRPQHLYLKCIQYTHGINIVEAYARITTAYTYTIKMFYAYI